MPLLALLFSRFLSLRNASGLQMQLTSFVAIGPKELTGSHTEGTVSWLCDLEWESSHPGPCGGRSKGLVSTASTCIFPDILENRTLIIKRERLRAELRVKVEAEEMYSDRLLPHKT